VPRARPVPGGTPRLVPAGCSCGLGSAFWGGAGCGGLRAVGPALGPDARDLLGARVALFVAAFLEFFLDLVTRGLVDARGGVVGAQFLLRFEHVLQQAAQLG